MTSNPASEHREIAGAFGALVRSADPSRWDDQSPVPDWRARDVVDHLVTWLPDLLSSGSSARLEAGPSAADDPVAAWEHHEAAVQALLDDPATGGL
ncbi:MAG: maleylpyruvate isomerase N-terminal domain-containing protein, partial [Marmoricola sp.]